MAAAVALRPRQLRQPVLGPRPAIDTRFVRAGRHELPRNVPPPLVTATQLGDRPIRQHDTIWQQAQAAGCAAAQVRTVVSLVDRADVPADGGR